MAKKVAERRVPPPPQPISGQGGYPPNCWVWDSIDMTLAVEDANSRLAFILAGVDASFFITWIFGNLVTAKSLATALS